MCVLVDKLLSQGVAPNKIRLKDYGQYAVDFGDRRVFAGVHYPSDNLASWVAVLRLIPWVFSQNGGFLVDFIRTAIIEQSAVYRLMQDTFPRHDALSSPLAYLQSNVTTGGTA